MKLTKRMQDFYKRWQQTTTAAEAYTMEREAQQNYREAKTDIGRERWDYMVLIARIRGNDLSRYESFF